MSKEMGTEEMCQNAKTNRYRGKCVKETLEILAREEYDNSRKYDNQNKDEKKFVIERNGIKPENSCRGRSTKETSGQDDRLDMWQENVWKASTVICCATLIERQGHCPLTAAHLQTAALVISWLSIVFSLGTGIAGLVLSVAGKSEALFAYGLDAILDSFSSVAVVWRFQVKVDHIYCAKRERKACIVIGFLFIASATSLIAKAVDAIIVEIRETKVMVVIQQMLLQVMLRRQIVLYESFALSCGIISVLIATAKIYVGLKIGSQALYTDSIITYVGAATCFAGVAGLELYVQNTNLWYLDSVFGIICGLFLLLFGIKLLYTKLREKDIEEQDF